MEKYLVFSFEHYYPTGGMNDFVESFDTLEAAEIYISERKEKYPNEDEYFQIFNLETRLLIDYDRMNGPITKGTIEL